MSCGDGVLPITRYFPILRPKRKNQTTFFSLPPAIRKRIYRFSGIIPQCPIDLNSAKLWKYDYTSDSEAEDEDESRTLLEDYTTSYKCYFRNYLGHPAPSDQLRQESTPQPLRRPPSWPALDLLGYT